MGPRPLSKPPFLAAASSITCLPGSLYLPSFGGLLSKHNVCVHLLLSSTPPFLLWLLWSCRADPAGSVRPPPSLNPCENVGTVFHAIDRGTILYGEERGCLSMLKYAELCVHFSFCRFYGFRLLNRESFHLLIEELDYVE